MPLPPKFNYKKAGLILVSILLACFAMSYLFAGRVSVKNTTLVTGHFKAVEKSISNGRGGESVSYDLYLKEQPDPIQISADFSACFYYDTFLKEVKDGQLVQIYINNPLFFSLRRSPVAAISANNVTYLYFDCVNDGIEKDRKQMPLMCIVLFLLITVIIYKKEIKAHISSSNNKNS